MVQSTALQRFRTRIRPWHILVLFVLVVVVMIALAIVVHFTALKHNVGTKGFQAQPGVSDPSIARVNLGYTSYQGTKLPGGVNEYLGVRFAAAPTGNLRWRAPINPPVEAGIQPANTFGKICLGISAPTPNMMQGEDCLFANVWAPTNATVNSKLPVWLFIQGGGYTVNSNANWNGSEVVQRSGSNMILVNFNYRVGLWGFLASERLRANGDLNAGLLDQRMMMKVSRTSTWRIPTSKSCGPRKEGKDKYVLLYTPTVKVANSVLSLSGFNKISLSLEAIPTTLSYTELRQVQDR